MHNDGASPHIPPSPAGVQSEALEAGNHCLQCPILERGDDENDVVLLKCFASDISCIPSQKQEIVFVRHGQCQWWSAKRLPSPAYTKPPFQFRIIDVKVVLSKCEDQPPAARHLTSAKRKAAGKGDQSADKTTESRTPGTG